jgi:hypothetical protein
MLPISKPEPSAAIEVSRLKIAASLEPQNFTSPSSPVSSAVEAPFLSFRLI